MGQARGVKSKVTEKHSPIFIKALKRLALCLALCVSASALAKDDAVINHAPAKGATACEELLNQKPYSQKPYGKIIKRMAAIKMQLSKNALMHGGKQSQRKVEDIGLSAAYDILDKQLQGQLPKEQYKAALIELDALVSKVIAKLEESENKKAQTIAALKSKRMALINKKAELAEEIQGINNKDLDINVEVRRGKGRWPPIIMTVRDLSRESVLLYYSDGTDGKRLLYPNGESYFANAKPGKDVNDIMEENHHIHINSNGDAVVFSGAYEYIINNKARVISKSMPFRKKSLVALGEGELFIVNFRARKLLVRDIHTGVEKHVALEGFTTYDYGNDYGTGKKTPSNRYKFHKIFKDKRRFWSAVTNNKLIAIYPEDKSAFVVDVKSGDAQYIDDQFIDKIERLVSVDNMGNIYGVAFKDDRKVLEVFKFSPESETLAKAVSKTTLKIDGSGFKGKNFFGDATVDSSGALIITAERPHGPDPNEGAGFYIYSMDTGKAVSNSSILDKEEPWPHRIINYGQNQLLFLAVGDHGYKPFPLVSNKISKPSHIYSAKLNLDDATIETIKKITHQMEEAKAQLQDVEWKLAEASK